MALRLVVDSSSDLPKEIIKKYAIQVVPLFVTIHGKEYLDGVDLTPKEFYESIQGEESKPFTSQVTPERFAEVFRKNLEAGDEVLCITIGSNASGTWQSANLAKEDVGSERITVVDSNMLCMGTGYICLLAATMIEEGRSLEEILERIVPLTQNRIEHLFSVDTLEFLKRGGRIKTSKAFVADILNIKPILNAVDATTQPIGKVRGRKKIIPFYLQHMEKNFDFDESPFLSIAHSEDLAFAQEFAQAFREKFSFEKPIYFSEIGATIGTHTGPGVLAVFYIKR